MIWDVLSNFYIVAFRSLLCDLFGENPVPLSIPQTVFNGASNLFGCLSYIFPIAALLPILVFSVNIRIFHAVYALVLRIYNIVWGS